MELVYYVSTVQGFYGWYLWDLDSIVMFDKCPWNPQLVY